MSDEPTLTTEDEPHSPVPGAVEVSDDGLSAGISQNFAERAFEALPDAPEKAPMGFVHLGTGTERSRRLYEQRFREAEARRDQADADALLAKDQIDLRYEDERGERAITKLPGHDGGAVQYTTQFTQHPEVPKAYIHLIYLDRAGYETGLRCLTDLFVGLNPARPTELCICLVCPSCTANTHKHAQDNQLRISQSNKYFDFRAAMGPPTFSFRDPVTRQVGLYNSAGMVMESEPFRCPDCGWRARIVQNRVRPD